MPTTDLEPERTDASALTAGLLDQDEDLLLDAAVDETAVVADEDLIGVGADEMPLREVLRTGGWSTALVLFGLNFVDEFDRITVSLLGPEIQRTFGIGDAALTAINNIGAVAVLAGVVPLGVLADRRSRKTILGLTSLLWAAAAAAGGLARNALQLTFTRIFNGLGKGNDPVRASMLSDAYPVEGRGRIFGMHELANPIANTLAPLIVGAIAAGFATTVGWRWALALLSIPAFILAVATFLLREPERGKYEREAVGLEGGDEGVADDPGFDALGAVATDESVSMAAGFQRLRSIKSFSALLTAVSAFGLGISGAPTLYFLVLESEFGLDAVGRGTVQSISTLGGIVGLAAGATFADRLFRRDPGAVMKLIAGALATFGVLFPLGIYMPNVFLLTAVGVLASAALNVPGAAIKSMIAVIVPPRMRGLAYGMIGIYLVLVGGLLGGVLTGLLSDSIGQRPALAIVMPTALFAAAITLVVASRSVRADVALVKAEMLEDQQEAARVAAGSGSDDVLQVRGVDFSYGPVQVLFDVDLTVHRGEVLALLGTNGAGKSTVLRVISGLGVPTRGTVRFNGHNVTLADASHRVRSGIVQVPGGKAIFPSLTVEENLLAGAYSIVWEKELVEQRAEEVLELFPRLRERLDQPAGTLSGGEAQMLAIAKALMLEPELLLIDELSLGLAPVIVQDLLGVVEELNRRGITIVIVEQSVNVALAVADRAVFMEKGQVRFEGPAQDLLERDDLVRAVFLGGEGG